MAKRFTDTDIWDKVWFMSLSLKEKLLIRFIYDKCDASGVWSINWILASTYIGEKVDESDLKNLSQQIEILPGNKIFIPAFVEFQYGQLSENCMPHKKIFSLLKNNGLLERVMKGYQKPTCRLQDKEEDKEKDKDKEEEEEKDKERRNRKKEKPDREIFLPFASEEFAGMWAQWKEFRATEHKFHYKSPQSEQATLTELSNISKGIELTAIAILKQSMANGWKGLFELKSTNNGHSENWTKPNNPIRTEGGYNAAYKRELVERMAGGTGAANQHPNGNT